MSRIIIFFACITFGIGIKVGVIFYAVYGFYVMDQYVQPIIAFLIADAFLYFGLLAVIVLSLMRSRDRLKAPLKRRESITDYSPLLEERSDELPRKEVPLSYQV